MFTFGAPMMMQTEPPNFSKIQKLATSAVLLFAGSVPDGEEIVSGTQAKIAATRAKSVSAMAAAVKDAYVELKAKRVEETILQPWLGAGFEEFRSLIAQSAASQILQQVLGAVSQHNLQLDVLVAGLDDAGSHLFVVGHPGVLLPLDTVGYTAIGSGGLHASVRLSLAQHTKANRLVEAVYSVYEAKRAADVAPGVGKLTDMAVLRDGAIFDVPESLFKVLEDLHKERPALSDAEKKRLEEACDECFAKRKK
jgi:20S proteasome alpha/beta subunit